MRLLTIGIIAALAATASAQQPQKPPAKQEKEPQKRQQPKKEQKKPSDTWWRTDYEKARKEAIDKKRVLVLVYGGLGDKWTEKLRKTLGKESLGEAAAKVVCCFVKVDDFAVVSKFRVRRLDVPTVLFVWPREQRVFGRLLRPAHFRAALPTLKKALQEEAKAHKLLASAKPGDLLELARFFLSLNEFAEAERALRRTISLAKEKKEPKIEAHVLLLSVHIGRNEPYRIRAELEALKKLDPDQKKFPAERLFAQAYMEQFVTRDRKKAEDLWRRILKEHPKFDRIDEVKLYLGLILYARADVEGAKKLWQEVAEGKGEPSRRARAFLKLATIPAPATSKQKEQK